MDELKQHISVIASLSEHDVSLPGGLGPLTAVVAARTLLEMAEETALVRSRPRVAEHLERAVDACDDAALELR